MPTNVVMPQLGESINEGTITRWLKKPGDTVEKDEMLFEISTDKVDAEISSPVAGVLSEIKIAEGATVEVNVVIAVIAGGADLPEALPASVPERVIASAVPAPKRAEQENQIGCRDAIHCSPLVRRLAREKNLNLRKIPATGLGGRITKGDALGYLSRQGTGGPAVPVVPQAPDNIPAPIEPAAAQAASAMPPGEESSPPSVALLGTSVPLTRMRTIIAQRMVESMQISPHVHTVFKVDMTRIVRLREREKSGFERHNGVRLTYMPFIAIAAVQSLRKFRIVNASMESSSIRYRESINLGIAVALEGGLIVPVVKQAEERNFLGVARMIADLAERARAKRLKPEETSGSTFTLTNSGIFGEEFATPIINQPDSAILAIGGLKKEPLVLTDTEGNDSIAIRSVQHFCLGFDHRIIDGADAGKFMTEFKETLENWDQEIW